MWIERLDDLPQCPNATLSTVNLGSHVTTRVNSGQYSTLKPRQVQEGTTLPSFPIPPHHSAWLNSDPAWCDLG